ncbi:MAG: hypothetical protein MI923_03585, partial [Phycisphaerales bacterium]|nr:hypothetical protein [Phycisphaerales bacterium]
MDYLQDMLSAIDNSTTFIAPRNYKQETGMSVLIGRPLALVRASLELDLLGLPAMNQSKESFAQAIESMDPSKRDDGAATQVELPVRLGALSDIDDGMVGYFIDDGSPRSYQHFYSPAAPEDRSHGV